MLSNFLPETSLNEGVWPKFPEKMKCSQSMLSVLSGLYQLCIYLCIRNTHCTDIYILQRTKYLSMSRFREKIVKSLNKKFGAVKSVQFQIYILKLSSNFLFDCLEMTLKTQQHKTDILFCKIQKLTCTYVLVLTVS